MKKRVYFFIILLIGVSLIACLDSQNEADVNPDSIEANLNSNELLKRSEDISDWVVELYGIDDVTSIVFNNDAYIAVIMAFDQAYTEDLSQTIIHQVKDKDSLIENVFLTDNSRTFSQISDIVFNLLQGESYDSQVKDINKIINSF